MTKHGIPPTVEWRAGRVRLIDQRVLPARLVFLECERVGEVCDAIRHLVVRGAPILLYRADLAPHERIPFVLYTSMGLSILIAVTNIGVETGRMLPEIAAALVGAGMVSVLVFPALALRFRSRNGEESPPMKAGTVHAPPQKEP